MTSWFSHPTAPWLLLFTVLALGYQLFRFGRCRHQLSQLRRRLQAVVSADQDGADAAFEGLPLAPIQIGWASFRAGLNGGYSSPLSHLSWTPRLWTAELLSLHRTLWIGPLLLLCSPVLMWYSFTAGYERLARELANLSSLQVWEGSRAVFIVRHAVESFITWAEPGFYAALLALTGGLAVLLSAALTNWLLRRQLDALQVQLQRIFPPQPEGTNLQKIEEQLARMHELLVQLTESGSRGA